MQEPCPECKARMAVLERKLNRLLERTGMAEAEIQDLEMDEILEHTAKTLDFTALDQYLIRINNGKGRAA